MCKLPALILLVFCLYLFSSQPAFASTLFTDNFNDGNSTGWEEHLGSQGSWSIENGEYVGRVVKDSSEDLPTYSITGDGNWDNYQFDVRIKAQEGVDKIILFRYTSLNQTYAIKLISSWWDWYGDKIALLKNNLIGWTANTTYVNSIGNWYKISVAVNGPNIKIYVNDSISPVINYTDSNNPNTKGKIGLLVWPGYYGGYGSRTTTSFDDVVVTSLESPPPENNLILLPGLGASWNHEAMILDQEKLPEEWQMTPSIKTYDGLIQTLKYAGYKTEGPDQNLFIFNYDWRKPVAQIANDLKNYIGRHPPPSDKKIDLVGHSLGGLVARTYVQNNPENQINKLITVGSPHQGAVKTYYLWEGADLSQGLTGWQRYGAGILLQLHKKIYENNVEAIHSFAPGLKDILPTFPYLKYRSTEKPLANMLERNFWLENLNHLPLPGYLISNANTMIGSKGDTLRWIRTENRGMVDQVLGKWVDGKPNGEEYALGDNTVLLQSAELPGANIVELQDLDHGELVETTAGQQAIMDILQLAPLLIVEAPKVNYTPALIFQIASPATITVLDPNWQIIEENKKLVIITNPAPGAYQVRVKAEGDGGNYRLLIGRVTDVGDVWDEIDDSVGPGQTKTHFQGFDPELKNTKLELVNLARIRLDTARTEAQFLDKPAGNALPALIESRIRETGQIFSLLAQGKTQLAQNKLELAILSITRLENQLKNWPISSLVPPETASKILALIREAKDYLVQAYDLTD